MEKIIMNNEIMIIGDVHGEFGKLNTFISKKQPKIILQVGDFGYFPRWSWELHNPNKKRNEFSKLPTVKSNTSKIYFCAGNHEDHESLMSLKNNEVYNNVYYMKRGSILTLDDGRNVLFMGGAKSHDSAYRKNGIDWFKEEILSEKDVMEVDTNTKIDIVISHTAPIEFEIEKTVIGNPIKNEDSSRNHLSYILNTFKPSLWYFGHWHHYLKGTINGCKWTALNHIMGSNFFEYLP